MTEPSLPTAGFKKRRLRGSCDSCAQRKIKCDSAIVGIGQPCSNCVAFNTECTHTRGARQDEYTSARAIVNAAEKKQDLPEDSESRLEALKELVAYARHLERDNASLRKNVSASIRTEKEERTSLSPERYVPSTERTSPGVDELEGDEDELEAKDVIAGNRTRFFGNSSNMTLVRSAFEQLNLKETPQMPFTHETSRRAKFWVQPPWDGPSYEAPPVYRLPPDDLLYSLIDLYFIYVNPFMPTLHRPHFMKSVGERLWERNHHFGALLLCICSLASRFSKDTRCLWEGDPHSAGWQWFSQVKLFKETSWEPISLFELQMYCVAICYLYDTASHGMCWILASTGIRLAQDVGIHRSRGPPDDITEMWRRAYWTLIHIDTIIAAYLGRPRATSAQDHDLDMMQDVDDEYWESPDNPELSFKQPEGKPSTSSYYIAYLKLFDILGYAQKTLYAARKPIQGDAQDWTKRILVELDAALEKWKSSIPDHLKWDPNNQDVLFFNQSAFLQAGLAFVEIQIYRPFIPAQSRKSTFAFPALTSCLNVARSCCHSIDAQMKTNDFYPFPQVQMALFSAGIIMILHVWQQQKHGLNTDREIDLKDIKTILDIMKGLEDRFMAAGRFYDMLNEMWTGGKIEQLSATSRQLQQSRKRGNEELETDGSSPLTNISTPSSTYDSSSVDFMSQHANKSDGLTDPLSDYSVFSLPLFGTGNFSASGRQMPDPKDSFGGALYSVMMDQTWDPFATGWELDSLAQTSESDSNALTGQALSNPQGPQGNFDFDIDHTLLFQPQQAPYYHPHMTQFPQGTTTFQYR